MNYLAQLPVRVLKAKVAGHPGKYVPVLVDGDYDGEYFSEFRWMVLPGGYVSIYGSLHNHILNEKTGELLKTEPWPFTYLHQLVLPKKPGFWTKHINGNKLDNRSVNLRYMTPIESALTRPQGKNQTHKNSPVSSVYRGVLRQNRSGNGYRYISKNRWEARCRRESLGSFGSEIEAALAYDKRAKEIWGDMANLNFPEVNHETDL